MYSILQSAARTHTQHARTAADRTIHGAIREPRALSLSAVRRKKTQQGVLCPAHDAIASICRDVSFHGLRLPRCQQACAIAGICRAARLHGLRLPRCQQACAIAGICRAARLHAARTCAFKHAINKHNRPLSSQRPAPSASALSAAHSLAPT